MLKGILWWIAIGIAWAYFDSVRKSGFRMTYKRKMRDFPYPISESLKEVCYWIVVISFGPISVLMELLIKLPRLIYYLVRHPKIAKRFFRRLLNQK